MSGGSTMQGRSWVTAKGWRHLGYPIPDDIADDEVITPIVATTPRPIQRPRARRAWWRRR